MIRNKGIGIQAEIHYLFVYRDNILLLLNLLQVVRCSYGPQILQFL